MIDLSTYDRITDARAKRTIIENFARECKEKTPTQYACTYGTANRWQAQDIVGLTSLPRWLRHTILRGVQRDYDIENAWPTFLRQWCERNRFPIPYLIEYTDNRATIFDSHIDEHMLGVQIDETDPKLLAIKIRQARMAQKDVVKANYLALFNDWMSHIETTVFVSSDERDEWIKKNTPRVLSLIRGGQKPFFFLRKTSERNLFEPFENLGTATISWLEHNPKDPTKMKTCECSLQGLLIRTKGFLRKYRERVWNPKPQLDAQVLNMFPGIKANCVYIRRPADQANLAKLLDFLYRIICDSHDESYAFLLRWLRNAAVTPWVKSKVLIILFSIHQQCSGKSSMTDWFMKMVIGENIVATVSGLSQLTQRFNDSVENKRMITVEELPASQAEFLSQFDHVKNLISAEHVRVEPKFGSPFQAINCLEMFALTNHFGFHVPRGDMRTCGLRCNEVIGRGNRALWDDLHENVFTEHMGVVFYQYLLRLPECRVGDIPHTDLREELMEKSENSMARWARELRQRKVEAKVFVLNKTRDAFVYVWLPNEVDYPVGTPLVMTKDEAYKSYRAYTLDSGFDPKKNKLKHELNNEAPESMVTVEGIQRRVHTFV